MWVAEMSYHSHFIAKSFLGTIPMGEQMRLGNGIFLNGPSILPAEISFIQTLL